MWLRGILNRCHDWQVKIRAKRRERRDGDGWRDEQDDERRDKRAKQKGRERERTSRQLVIIKLQRKVIGRCWSACLFSSLWCCLCGPVQQRAEWTQTDEAQTSQHWTEQGQTEQNSRSPEPACIHFWFILSTDQIYRQITSNQNQCTLHDSLYRALQGSALVSRSTGFFG